MQKIFTRLLIGVTALPILAYASTDFYRNIPLLTGTSSENVDAHLINPWGFVLTKEANLVIANNGTNTSTIYTPTGGAINFNPGTTAPDRPTLFVNALSNPTGIVINPSKHDFKFKTSGGKKPAEYIYCTENGTLLAYSQEVDPLNAVIVANRSAHGSVYKGLEVAKVNNKYYLYATDFHNAKVDVFDKDFDYVKSFTDPSIPSGFAPFNVKNFNNKLYVTYAKQLPPSNQNDDPGLGNGFVDVFNENGGFISRLISHGNLNSPWGLAIAPTNFGPFSNALLVGNAGDGFINAYNLVTGSFLGQLSDSSATPIQIPRLWGLEANVSNFHHDRPQLNYTAGAANETDGVFGIIQFSGNETVGEAVQALKSRAATGVDLNKVPAKIFIPRI